MITEQITQTVTISGTPVLVHDCQVSRSSTERIGTIDFVVERDVIGSVYDAITLNDAVVVTHTGSTNTLTDTGSIERIEETVIKGAKIKRIHCRTQEALMRNIRVLKRWRDMSAGTVAAEIAGLHPDVTAGFIADGGRKVSRISSRFDTLYDCLEQIRVQTGLAWSVNNNQLSLFDPETRTSPDIEQYGFIDGSLQTRINTEAITNVARMQAWEYQDIEICAPACSTFAPLPIEGYGWEVSGEVEESPLFFPDGFEINISAKEARWPQNELPFRARFQARRLFWVEIQEPTSISVYGRRDGAPLYHDGGVDTTSAVGILEAHLRRWAWPIMEASGIQPVVFGHSVDSFCRLNVPSLGIDRNVEVVGVRRTFRRNELSVQVDIKGILDD